MNVPNITEKLFENAIHNPGYSVVVFSIFYKINE